MRNWQNDSFIWKDKGLIESSINNVYQSYFGVEKYPTIEEKAARLCYSFIKNHAFLDGNKRIGIYVMMVLLELNGISLNCSNDELTELGLKIADSSIGYSEILEFIYKFK